MTAHRLPPMNEEAEASVLGTALLGPIIGELSAELALRPEHFYRERHRVIYEAMLSLADRNEPVDPLTVTAEVDRQGKLDAAGGTAYIHSLPNLVPAAAHFRSYASEVLETARFREIIDAGREIMDAAFLGDHDLIARAEGKLASPAANRRRRATVERRQHDLVDHVDRGDVVTWPWPFPLLNELTGGIWPGQFTVIAAMTGFGKSVLLDQALEKLAQRGLKVAAYLNEMSALERDLRFIARKADIPLRRLMLAKLHGEDEQRAFARAVQELPFEIVPAGGMSAKEIARDIHRNGWDAIGVDLLNGLPGSSRVEDIDENVRTLVSAANESGCHVLACQHLNRNRLAQHPYPPKPSLGDIRGSGQIADLANNVLFLHRYERELDDGTPSGKPGDESVLDLAKVRMGVLGEVPLRFVGSRMLFGEVERGTVGVAA